jgi:hypothetical protein
MKQYHAIKVERAKVAPVEFLTVTFDSESLSNLESFLNEVTRTGISGSFRYEYALAAKNNLKAMKGY